MNIMVYLDVEYVKVIGFLCELKEFKIYFALILYSDQNYISALTGKLGILIPTLPAKEF